MNRQSVELAMISLTDLGETHVELLVAIFVEVSEEYLPCVSCVCKQWLNVLSGAGVSFDNIDIFRELVASKDAKIITWLLGCDAAEAELFADAFTERYHVQYTYVIPFKKAMIVDSDYTIEYILKSPGILKGCPKIVNWLFKQQHDIDWCRILSSVALREDEEGVMLLGNLLTGEIYKEVFNDFLDHENLLNAATLLFKAGFLPDFEFTRVLLQTHEGQHLVAQYYWKTHDRLLNMTLNLMFSAKVPRPLLENIEWIQDVVDRIDKLEIFELIIVKCPEYVYWFCSVVGWSSDKYLTDIATEILNGRYNANVNNSNYFPHQPHNMYVHMEDVYLKFADIMAYYCINSKEDTISIVDKDELAAIIKQVDDGKFYTVVQKTRWRDSFGNYYSGFF